MPLTGEVLRTRTLKDSCGATHIVTFLRPDDSPHNRRTLLEQERAWRVQMRAQPFVQQRRAKLAVDTAFSASHALGFRRDNHFILAAQDETGALRGLITFLLYDQGPKAGVWEIALLTVSPNDQGGSIAPCTLRGVGSELTGTAADIMATKACSRTELSPLDEQAREFYIRRGFTCPPGTPSAIPDCTLSCEGLKALAATYAHSPQDDQDMVIGQRSAPVMAARW